MASLLEEFRHQKDIWFDTYGSSATSTNRQEPSRYGKQPQGQYGIYGNGFGFGGAYRPYGSSNPYGCRPFVPYDGSYQNNNSTNSQQVQPQQQQRPPLDIRQPLQITNGNANASPSGTNQPRPNPNANYGSNRYGNRNPFRPYSNGSQQRPYARAYQHDVEPEKVNKPMDEQVCTVRCLRRSILSRS